MAVAIGTGAQDVVSKRTTSAESLVSVGRPPHNPLVKGIAVIVAAAAILLGVYYYYLKQLPRTDSGTAATQAISLTGVRNDLLQIGQAERGSIALNGKCSSLDELISSGALGANRTGRDGYTYQVSCSGASDFQVLAEHPPAQAGSGIRYPKLALDSTIQIQEVQ
jgi:hypothetical protein